jgi:hypothetical protein
LIQSPKASLGTGQGSVVINENFSIRLIDDFFGRRMTELRRSFTNNDTEPFETAN